MTGTLSGLIQLCKFFEPVRKEPDVKFETGEQIFDWFDPGRSRAPAGSG